MDNNVSQKLLDLFQEYTRQTQHGQIYPLFEHQAEVFRLIEANEEVFLVAGTAAGKTLAISVPLFQKLAAGHMRRVLLLYPTIALMEDQRRVLDGLAGITGLEIGLIQGGMSRSELIEALGKPVLLATPDAIYWFFHKNVKYSSLLIYGLMLVDAVVLDEAHLFNGLMLQNLSHLKERMHLLGERVGNRTRWHILTATPTPELRVLTQGREVRGQSKCSDVTVTFCEPVQHPAEYPRQIAGAVNTALAQGAEHVLVVLNAADMAHRIFEWIRVTGRHVELPVDLLLKFGWVRWGELEQWLQHEAAPAETITEIRDALAREHPPHLKDLAKGVRTQLSAETFMRCLTEQMEQYKAMTRRLITAATHDEQFAFLAVVDAQLVSARGDLRLLWRAFARRAPAGLDPQALLRFLDTWTQDLLSAVERACGADQFVVTAPAFPEMQAILQRAGFGSALAGSMTRALSSRIALPEQDAAYLATTARVLAKRLVSFSWLPRVIGDHSRAESLFVRLETALSANQLPVEARHIATWSGTQLPVIIYTGKMTKTERDGLIDAFARLPAAILISTPAVEVGVDFAADTLITEECDGNAFLQRFGRVGRRTGIVGTVIVFLKRQGTYVLLAREPRQMSRLAFSDLIAHPLTGCFPRRSYTERSRFVEVVHYLTNAHLGEIGGWLNQRMFGAEVAELARTFGGAGLSFSYGLRSTLPGISLSGGAGGADPFYILRKVENKDLLPSDSPFEMARSEMPYLEFLWADPASLTIAVDTQATLEASQALLWWQDQRWHIRVAPGIARDYVTLFNATPARGSRTYRKILEAVAPDITQDVEAFLRTLQPQGHAAPIAQLLLRVGEALPLFFAPHSRLILGQGSVHLRRLAPDGHTDFVEDEQGNQLPIPEQCWLLLLDYSKEEARKLLAAVDCLDLEEVIYPWHSYDLVTNRGLFLLDRAAGACFTVYQRLVAHVTGQV